MPLKHGLLIAGCLALACSVGSAQAPPQTDQVDMSALHYYATHHETARVDAEIRRLRSLYPGWQPPADPASIEILGAASVDQPLWELFGADRLDELNAEIAKRKAADPSWVPPPELVSKLALKQSRLALLAASERKDDRAVIDLAMKTPALVDASDPDVAWRVAEAYGRTGASQKALAIDRAILNGSKDAAVRLATVRMAVPLLAPADLQSLIAMGTTGPDGTQEFDAATFDLVRQNIGRILAGTATGDVAPQDLARLEKSARTASGAGDAALLGWLNAKRKSWSAANTWFGIALAAGPAPDKAEPGAAKTAQGAVLALKALGRRAEAEELAYRWRDADPALMLLYVDVVEPELTQPRPVAVDEQELQRFSDVVASQQSGDGAQALGWYAYNIGQLRPARAWFERAMAWQPRDSTALGLALSLKKLGDTSALAAFVRQNQPTYPTLSALGRSRPMRAEQAPSARVRLGGRGGAPDRPSGFAMGDHRSIDDAGCFIRAARQGASSLDRGWCLMALNRPHEAAEAFAASHGTGPSGDAAYGQALAELRNKQSDAAIQAAGSEPLSPGRRNEIGIAALAQTASTAFDETRYAATLRALDQRRMFTPETRELALLRAWSLHHLDREEEAKRLFGALDQQISTPESQAGLAASNTLRTR